MLQALGPTPSTTERFIAYARANLAPVTPAEDVEALRRHQLRPTRATTAQPRPPGSWRTILGSIRESLWFVALLVAFAICCLLLPAHAATRVGPEPSRIADMLVALIPGAIAVGLIRLATRRADSPRNEPDGAYGDTTGLGGLDR